MAKGNVNPAPPPNPAANPTPSPSAPPPTGTGGGGPTGNSGYSMNDSSMQGLQNKAGDLGSRLSSISSGLRGLNFSGNALGPIGLFAVPALNASNDNAVAQAEKGAKAFTDVQSGIKATHQTAVNTDASQSSNLKSFDTSTNAKPPPGSTGGGFGLNSQGGPKVSGAGTIAGGGTGATGLNSQGGPKVLQNPNIKGGTGPARHRRTEGTWRPLGLDHPEHQGRQRSPRDRRPEHARRTIGRHHSQHQGRRRSCRDRRAQGRRRRTVGRDHAQHQGRCRTCRDRRHSEGSWRRRHRGTAGHRWRHPWFSWCQVARNARWRRQGRRNPDRARRRRDSRWQGRYASSWLGRRRD
ncbi:hypothetical protein FXN61_46670, partial [Lentzea sp. PSKA42]|nr:hypothetical protein [Lentzea indica]